MPTLPLQAAIAARKQYLASYGKCIAILADLLRKSRLTHVFISYDILEPRCYNVNNTSGQYDTNIIVKLALDEDGGLVAYDDSDNQYELGHDENGQDNYTLVNLDYLVYKVVRYVEDFQKHLIAVEKPSKVAMFKALIDYLKPYKGRGENGIYLFSDRFYKPKLQNNEPVQAITFNEVTTVSPDGKVTWFFLQDLSAHELRVLIDAINEHTLFLHNSK